MAYIHICFYDAPSYAMKRELYMQDCGIFTMLIMEVISDCDLTTALALDIPSIAPYHAMYF